MPATVRVEGDDHVDPVDVATSQQHPLNDTVESQVVPPSSTSEPAIPLPVSPTPPNQTQSLPPHLRERWFVNPNLSRPRDTGTGQDTSAYYVAYMHPTFGSTPGYLPNQPAIHHPIPTYYTLPHPPTQPHVPCYDYVGDWRV